MKLSLRSEHDAATDWLVVNFNPLRYAQLCKLLIDDDYEIFPLTEVFKKRRSRSRKEVVVEKQIIPGFMFIRHTERPDVTSLELQLKYQVRPFLFNERFVKVRDGELRSMAMTASKIAEKKKQALQFNVGETVIVTTGVFTLFGYAQVVKTQGNLITVVFKKFSQELQISAWLLAKVPV